ncbi:ubiquitin hydrolase [Trypanosoma cruzi marinkellei]|uniref:Ubiquitin hydrolase n=1 Tax=Trypanosoma cruzi marinkellei TaxID=85056 RepID=K2MK26_TRYCR|nr:ubiquitin hydrolase [Trypanosoma cruzi marinkellei]
MSCGFRFPRGEPRAVAAASAATRRTRAVLSSPHTRRCATAGGNGAMSTVTCKGFAATMPLPPASGGAGVGRSRAASRLPFSFELLSHSVLTERPPTPRRDTWGADEWEEAEGSGLQLASHAVTMGARPRVRDCRSRHAQLLSLEREQHRVVTDRLYQQVQKLSLKWTQEREAHASTTLSLFRTQMDVCILQEESARHAIAAAEAEERIGFMQLERSRELGGCHRERAETTKRMEFFSAARQKKPHIIYAYDSDLLRALQRSEAYIVHLERYCHEQLPCFSPSAFFASHYLHGSPCSETWSSTLAGTALDDDTASYVPLSQYIRTIM